MTVGGAPGLSYPRIPGHEVIGVVDAVGEGVTAWQAGTRVGVGWSPGACGYCTSCRHGNRFGCKNTQGSTGVTRDGGYGTHMVDHASALARVPPELDAVE